VTIVHFPDLGPCDYFHLLDPAPVAVGWLDGEHPYERGSVQPSFLEALARIAQEPWQPFYFMGWHNCELCASASRPGSIEVAGIRVTTGINNVFVPGDGVVYAAPSLILHYIVEHEYLPPLAFQRAVESCPAMGSRAYYDALRAAGLKEVDSIYKPGVDKLPRRPG